MDELVLRQINFMQNHTLGNLKLLFLGIGVLCFVAACNNGGKSTESETSAKDTQQMGTTAPAPAASVQMDSVHAKTGMDTADTRPVKPGN